jgi:hypothetical protein
MGVDDEEGVGLVRGGSPPFPSTSKNPVVGKEEKRNHIMLRNTP